MANDSFSVSKILRATLKLWWALLGFVIIVLLKTVDFKKISWTMLWKWFVGNENVFAQGFWILIVVTAIWFVWYIYGPMLEYQSFWRRKRK